ncbi:MAG: 3-dehydroquinate synthase [Bacteroidales bacterium]|nr:3-dehydroquinate synthase [Bacteroidales bacterium]
MEINTGTGRAYFCPSADELSEALGQCLRHAAEPVSQVFILVDENTRTNCLPLLQNSLGNRQAHVIEIPSGEKNKTIDTCIFLWDQLMAVHADRKSLLINLGGGVITDMGGFAASVYKRGIRFIHIPTTLLAMVDASIGGKTGVDFRSYKNQIGLFSFPWRVIIHPPFLETLPGRHVLNGFAEMVKYALIANGPLWSGIQIGNPRMITGRPEMIRRCIQIKSSITERDPLEKGERKILNFGHTIGHALESWALERGSQPVLHGEAVAAGIVCEAFLSAQRTGLQKEHLESITTYILSTFPPVRFSETDFDHLTGLMQADKKNEYGAILFSLLETPGKCLVNQEVDPKEIRSSLQYYIEKLNERKLHPDHP